MTRWLQYIKQTYACVLVVIVIATTIVAVVLASVVVIPVSTIIVAPAKVTTADLVVGSLGSSKRRQGKRKGEENKRGLHFWSRRFEVRVTSTSTRRRIDKRRSLITEKGKRAAKRRKKENATGRQERGELKGAFGSGFAYIFLSHRHRRLVDFCLFLELHCKCVTSHSRSLLNDCHDNPVILIQYSAKDRTPDPKTEIDRSWRSPEPSHSNEFGWWHGRMSWWTSQPLVFYNVDRTRNKQHIALGDLGLIALGNTN